VPIFLNYDGVPGDVAAEGHQKWIEISSFQWGVGRGIRSATSRGADREGTTPSVSEITLTKVNDSASPNLLRASLGLPPVGEGKTVKIDFCKTDTSEPEAYLQITLENTLVSSWSTSSGGDRPVETISLNFTKVEYKNTQMGAANDTKGSDPAMYDLTRQKGC
jgi:type VI secretion system secreted protein Hcp